MKTKAIVFCLGLMLLTVQDSFAKPWRGIVPLKSNRMDVERLLGPSEGNEYRLPRESVYVVYAPSENWPFPIASGTVITVTVFLRYRVTPRELGIRLSEFTKERGASDIPESYTYLNEKEGFTVEVVKGVVRSLTYEPTRSQVLQSKRRTRK